MFGLVVLAVFPHFVESAAITDREISSVVQIVILDAKSQPYASGSGTFIDAQGDILTNYHVLSPALENKDFTWIASTTFDEKSAPSPCLITKLIAADKSLDLAVVRTVAFYDMESGASTEIQSYMRQHNLDFAYVSLDRHATSEGVSLGDDLEILGYPEVGGDTITYTKGAVSGFARREFNGQSMPGWIKTDAKLNPGNSGGAAFDSQGAFVGVPKAVAGGPGNIGIIISLPVVNSFLNEHLGVAPPEVRLSPKSLAGIAAAQDAAVRGQVADALGRAQRLKASGDKSGAMAAYRQVLTLDSHNAIAHNELGTLFYAEHQMDQAIGEFKQAVQWNPIYALAFFNLGYTERKANRCPDAIVAYQRYSQLQPNDPDGLWGLAECLRQVGQNLKAADVYDAYARLETRPSESRYKQEALSYSQQLRVPAAPTPRAVAPPAPPPSPPATAPTQSPAEAYLARGDALLAKNPRDALYAYQDAVRADLNNAKAHFKVAIAYAQLGYFPQAIDEWNRVLQLTPGNTAARDNIQRAQARIAAAQQQAAQAAPPPVANSAQAAAVAKQDYDQAVQLIQQRRYAEAATSLTSAIQVKPDFAVAYVARGSAMVGLGRFQDAVQDYLHGLGLNSNQAAPLFGLGEAYRGMGDRARAAKYYQECADSSAPDAPPLHDLARRRFSELGVSADEEPAQARTPVKDTSSPRCEVPQEEVDQSETLCRHGFARYCSILASAYSRNDSCSSPQKASEAWQAFARFLIEGCEKGTNWVQDNGKRSSASLKRQACQELGGAYAEGLGVPKDLGEAAIVFKKAASLGAVLCRGGDPGECNALEATLDSDDNPIRDHAQALEAWREALAIYRKGCQSENAEACGNAAGTICALAVADGRFAKYEDCSHENKEALSLDRRGADLYDQQCSKGNGESCWHFAALLTSGESNGIATAITFGLGDPAGVYNSRAQAYLLKGCTYRDGPSCADAGNRARAHGDLRAAKDLFEQACALGENFCDAANKLRSAQSPAAAIGP